jgi:transposase
MYQTMAGHYPARPNVGLGPFASIWPYRRIHACVDTNGLPVRLGLTTGEVHDHRLVTKLLSDLKSRAMLLADRGYDADWIRAFAGEHGA